MNWNDQTIKTYDDSAEELAGYFKGFGARTEDIERGLQLAGAGANNAQVVEIGCGDGRDAEEIVRRTAWYEGFDPSQGLLDIARKRLPETSFIQADALTYDYPEKLDVIYAFASLLHVNRTDMTTALSNAATALKDGGILYLSLKERPSYQEEAKNDQYGSRMFYYYNPAAIQEVMHDSLKIVYEDHQTIGHTDWFTLALQKTV